MLTCFAHSSTRQSIPIISILHASFAQWLSKQNNFIKNSLQHDVFKAEPGSRCLLKDGQGHLTQVLLGIEAEGDIWPYANLPRFLPEGVYRLEGGFSAQDLQNAVLGWGLGNYQFTPYKKAPALKAQLQMPSEVDSKYINAVLQSIFLARDLINTPTDDMEPAELAEAAITVAEEFGAQVKQIVGENLLKQNYPTIYTVGRGSPHAPRLVDIRWGNRKDPLIVLVGKGVCFDSGGLDIKNADGMLWMKKDMAGAAHALALARLIMAMKLPIQLRVLLPIVENTVSGEAYHPGDIITTRKGLTVEVTNTDAEGRLILCDALTEAAAQKPKMIFDFATLTGAAWVALGPELPALFCNDDTLAAGLLTASQQQNDPMWRMPLYKNYRRYLESQNADMVNSVLARHAGAITAALFLERFVPDSIPWAHFDFMAWNAETRHGRIFGGEVMVIRAVFHYLQQFVKKNK